MGAATRDLAQQLLRPRPVAPLRTPGTLETVYRQVPERLPRPT